MTNPQYKLIADLIKEGRHKDLDNSKFVCIHMEDLEKIDSIMTDDWTAVKYGGYWYCVYPMNPEDFLELAFHFGHY